MQELQALRAEFEALKAGLAYGQQQQQQPAVQQPQTVIVEKQVPVQNDAEMQRLQRRIDELERSLANKTNQPAPAPTTVVVPVPSTTNQGNKEDIDALNRQMNDLAARNKALEDKLYEINNRPQPRPTNTTINTTTTERIVVQEPYSDLLKRYPVINIYFETNSATIKEADLGKLAEVAGVLSKYSEARLSLIGYADKRGNAAHNLKLSEKRAEAVKRKLMAYGTEGVKLQLSYKGAATDAQPGDNPLARRVELKLTR